MLNQTYFPTTESERIIWIIHYISKLAIHAITVGIIQSEVTTTLKHLTYYVWISQDLVQGAQKYELQAITLRNSVAFDTAAGLQPLPVPVAINNPPEICPSGILTRLFNQIQRIKLSEGYSEAIGQDLGIIGSPKVDTHDYPEYSLAIIQGADAEQVVIKFKKYRHDAVAVDCRRNGGDWEHVNNAMSSPWIDLRPLQVANTPESREYRLRWCDRDLPGDTFSPVQKITVGI